MTRVGRAAQRLDEIVGLAHLAALECDLELRQVRLEIALKGGQMGQPDYFVKALRGTADARPSHS